MSSGIFSTLKSTFLTVKMFCSSFASTHGSVGCCLVIGFNERPMTGSPLMMPTTGFVSDATRVIARVMSYSSNCSRSGASTGSAAFWSRKLTARPR